MLENNYKHNSNNSISQRQALRKITAITLLMRKFNLQKDKLRWQLIQKSLNKKLNKRPYLQFNCPRRRHQNLQKRDLRKMAREWSQRRLKRQQYSSNSPRRQLKKLTCHRLRRTFSLIPRLKRKLSGASYASSFSVMRLKTRITTHRFRMIRRKQKVKMLLIMVRLIVMPKSSKSLPPAIRKHP